MNPFLIHPSDLAQRRKRCEPARQRLLAVHRECIAECNVCGSQKNVIIAERDRYGLPLRTVLCAGCGLIYLVDRLSAGGYGTFYQDGIYRDISSAFLGVQHSVAQIQANQADYGRHLVATLRGLVNLKAGASLLDIGGSAGIVSLEFRSAFGVRAVVLEPSAEEAGAARKAGLETVQGSIEDWSTDEKFDLILLCRSVEHFSDLKTALANIRRLLAPNGLFYCDIADFMELCRLTGAPETIAKIDHCYWLSHDTAPAIFRAAGLEVVTTNLVFRSGQVGFLMRPCEPLPVPPLDPQWVQDRIRRFMEIESVWARYGGTYSSWGDWLRRKAYRAKRRLVNALGGFRPSLQNRRVASANNRSGLS